LADLGERVASASPGCRALHVDWPGWRGDGLGERPDLARLLADAGITAIGVAEAARQLLKAFGQAGLPGRIAVHGRAGVPAPRPVAVAGARRSRPGAVAPGRFTERVLVNYPGVEVVTESTLAVLTDPYLADYRVDGLAVLPAAVAMEAMAQAAAMLAGGPVRTADDVLLGAPVVLAPGPAAGQAVIRVSAERDGDAIAVRLRCDDSGYATDHCRATFRAGPGDPGPAEPPGDGEGRPETQAAEVTLPASRIYGPVCFQDGRFRVLTEVRLGPSAATGQAEVSGGTPWFGAVPPPRGTAGPELVLGSPVLADLALQLAQASVPDRRLLFAGCDHVWFAGGAAEGPVSVEVVAAGQLAARDQAGPAGSASQPGPAATVPRPRHAAGERADQPLRSWDATITDAAGQPLVIWRGLRMRDAGPLAQPAPAGTAATPATPETPETPETPAKSPSR
ncbi:MAG TPA: polyketide synthase dehydratase domain-containing protein, partial [Streptosporangiaceae bacterium]